MLADTESGKRGWKNLEKRSLGEWPSSDPSPVEALTSDSEPESRNHVTGVERKARRESTADSLDSLPLV